MCASHTRLVSIGQCVRHGGVKSFNLKHSMVTNAGVASSSIHVGHQRVVGRPTRVCKSEHGACSRKIRARCSMFCSLNTQPTLVGLRQLSTQPQTQTRPLGSEHPHRQCQTSFCHLNICFIMKSLCSGLSSFSEGWRDYNELGKPRFMTSRLYSRRGVYITNRRAQYITVDAHFNRTRFIKDWPLCGNDSE